MSKYDGLRDFLATRRADVPSVTLSFAEIEKLVGPLPPSARTLRQWWANNSLVQAMAWRSAGWHVESVNLDAERVVFARGARGGSAAGAQGGTSDAPAGGRFGGPSGGMSSRAPERGREGGPDRSSVDVTGRMGGAYNPPIGLAPALAGGFGDSRRPADRFGSAGSGDRRGIESRRDGEGHGADTFVVTEPEIDDPADGGPASRDGAGPGSRAAGWSHPPAAGITQSEVRRQLVRHLRGEGWTVVEPTAPADAGAGNDAGARSAAEAEILATRDGRTLAVRTKGYPAADGGVSGRGGGLRPVRSASQVRHWYADAVLKAMLTLDEHPDYEVAIGLPDAAIYRSLYERTRTSLAWIGIRVLFVDGRGGVDIP